MSARRGLLMHRWCGLSQDLCLIYISFVCTSLLVQLTWPFFPLSPCRQGGSEVAGVLGYVGDIAYSLRHFMDVYPPSVPLAVEAGLLDRCVTASCHVCVSLGNIHM